MRTTNTELVAALFGLLTIVLALILLLIFPAKAELAEGFRTPIIAFEFARSESDLSFLSGASEQSRTNRASMDKGHQWDMIFPFAYGGFLFFLLLGLLGSGYKIAWLGVPFALLVIPFDLMENVTLLNITEALQNSSSVEQHLASLHLHTWLKWGSIGMSILFIAIGLLMRKDYASAVLGGIVALSVGVCWVSGSRPALTEIMSLSVSVFFAWFFIKTVLQVRKARANT